MRKIIILTMCVVFVTALFASCSNSHKSNNADIISDIEQVGRTDNSTETDISIEDSSISDYIAKEGKMFASISFDTIMGTDRVGRTATSSLIISGNFCKGADESAVCITTIETIDKDGCTPERGKYAPVTLRIDSVIESTPSFSLEVGDSVTVAEFATWFKNETGYTVSYHDGLIPITEEGSQYILYIYEVDENVAKNFWPGLKYRAEALTIPVSQNHELTDIEIYEALNLPDDVIQCSKDLIDSFMNK